MSTIQSLKNFIRHGKQARVAPPPAEPTTNVSTTTIHAEQPRGHGKGLFGHKRQNSRDRAGNNEGAAAAAAAAATAAQGNGRGEKDESHAQGTTVRIHLSILTLTSPPLSRVRESAGL
ncbi:hypothetical protein KEM55_005429 [Ascosphaera atra]|nr:hypothetical protein KEM55_005429 [Ascosphaera atra]